MMHIDSQQAILKKVSEESLNKLDSLSDVPGDRQVIKDMEYQKNLALLTAIQVDNLLNALESSESKSNNELEKLIGKRVDILEVAVNGILNQMNAYTGYSRGDMWLTLTKNDSFPLIGNYSEVGHNMKFIGEVGFGEGYAQEQKKKVSTIDSLRGPNQHIMKTGEWVHIYDSQKCIDELIDKGIVGKDFYDSEKEEFTQKRNANHAEVRGYSGFSEWFNQTLFPVKWFDVLGNMEVGGATGFDKLKNSDPTKPISDYKLWLAQSVLGQVMPVILNSKLVQQIQDKERELADSKAKEAAHLAHKDLIGSVSHRLRNSLDPAVKTTAVLKRKWKNKKPEAVDRMLGDINDSLDLTDTNITHFAKYEKIEQEIEYNPIDVADTVDKVLSQYRVQFEENGIACSTNYGSDNTIKSSYNHVHLVFDNLVKNSLEAFAEAGTDNPQITLETHIDDDKLYFTYTDNGPGIDQETIKTLGKSITSTKPTSGLGIGILSVFRVMSVYDGHMEYISDLGKGVTVTGYFPKNE